LLLNGGDSKSEKGGGHKLGKTVFPDIRAATKLREGFRRWDKGKGCVKSITKVESRRISRQPEESRENELGHGRTRPFRLKQIYNRGMQLVMEKKKRKKQCVPCPRG